VDAFDSAVIRSSRGSIFMTPICAEPSQKAFSSWLEGLKKRCPQLIVVGTDSKAEYSLPATHNISRPAVLLIGNEAKGLSVELKGLVDKMIRIPMSGDVDSLNVACATSILLYELFNRSVRSNGIVSEGI
jgi:TrmH family RNA methyltransferase